MRENKTAQFFLWDIPLKYLYVSRQVTGMYFCWNPFQRIASDRSYFNLANLSKSALQSQVEEIPLRLKKLQDASWPTEKPAKKMYPRKSLFNTVVKSVEPAHYMQLVETLIELKIWKLKIKEN